MVFQLLEQEGDEYRGEESSAVKKAKLYYSTCMDKAATQEAGIQPLLQVHTHCFPFNLDLKNAG